MNDRIYFLDDSNIRWGFDDNAKPYYSLDVGKYGRSEYVDPFPCYSHKKDLVVSEIEYIESVVNLKFKPKWFILSHEFGCRTNGYASENKEWSENDSDETVLKPFITLCGKRIPILPAMTRYLVSHEFGHIIDYNICAIRKIKEDDFRKEYADFRGIPESKGYGARTWHLSVGEVIANDIRIVLFDREKDFWPHEVEHPLNVAKVIEYWHEQNNKLFPK